MTSTTRVLRLLLAGLLAGSVACTSQRGPDPQTPDPAPPVVEIEPEAGTEVATDGSEAPADPDAPAEAAEADVDTDVEPQAQRSRKKSWLARHAEAGLESMVIGTVIGAQFGGYGAPVGAVLFGLYGVVTGDVPFDSGRPSPRRPQGSRRGESADDALEREIEDEIAKQEELEREIEEELRRQEELLEQIGKQENVNAAIEAEHSARTDEEKIEDPLAAPKPPFERQIPDSIFDRTTRGEGKDAVLVKTLDADRDGSPELEILYDASSGALLSRSEDTDFDGTLDRHVTYGSAGQVESLSEDTNADGKPDRFVDFAGGAGTRVEVDRDFDGVRDGFYVYEAGTMAYEEHDTNNDGKVDRRVQYSGKHREFETEDTNFDGSMDFKTIFDARGVPVRLERDTNGDGKPDVWEFYEGPDAADIRLVRKEEDVNADGKVDITSHYKAGKLVRKEINDPSLL